MPDILSGCADMQVKAVCSSGGHFVKMSMGGLEYQGGETRLIQVQNFCRYTELLEALERLAGNLPESSSGSSNNVSFLAGLGSSCCAASLPCPWTLMRLTSCSLTLQQRGASPYIFLSIFTIMQNVATSRPGRSYLHIFLSLHLGMLFLTPFAHSDFSVHGPGGMSAGSVAKVPAALGAQCLCGPCG